MKPPATAAPDTDHRGNTGDAILEAAVELFAQRGYHATSMRDIAAAVEVRAAGIYHWYESKEAILLKLQDAFIIDLRAEVQAGIERQQRPEARMAAAVREHVVFHGLHTREAFVTDSEIRALSPRNRDRLVARRDEYQELFIGLIEDGVRAGVFTVSEVRIAAYAILLECTGVALWFDPEGPLSLDQLAEIHIELVLGSLGANRRTIAAAIRATQGKPTPA
ncbi:MAG: TetR/AcrR family transcriptional regulator [Actinomycetota bacterium]|nr:TetR/AcrR family transcriptional regulator [Actinomycetota bacterium]